MRKSIFFLSCIVCCMVSTAWADPSVNLSPRNSMLCEGQEIVLTTEVSEGFSDVLEYTFQYSWGEIWVDIPNGNSSVLTVSSFPGYSRVFRVRVRDLRGSSTAPKDSAYYSCPVCVFKCTLLAVPNIKKFDGRVEKGVAMFAFDVTDAEKIYLQFSKNSYNQIFQELAEVSGGRYSDPTILGKTYYRLKVVSPTGEVTYSKIILLNGLDLSKECIAKVMSFDGKIHKVVTVSASSLGVDFPTRITVGLPNDLYLIYIMQYGKKVELISLNKR